MSPSCKSCRFLHPEITQHHLRHLEEYCGECRLMPPRINSGEHDMSDFGRRIFPTVYLDDWCGSFLPDETR